MPDWETPPEFYVRMMKRFGVFKLDVAATQATTKVPGNWYGPDHPDPSRRNGLVRNWAHDSGGGSVWCNPPYGREIGDWMAKANDEAQRCRVVVCLVPARTDTAWFQDWCLGWPLWFLRGRLYFSGQKQPAPFPSVVVVMSRDKG